MEQSDIEQQVVLDIARPKHGDHGNGVRPKKADNENDSNEHCICEVKYFSLKLMASILLMLTNIIAIIMIAIDLLDIFDDKIMNIESYIQKYKHPLVGMFCIASDQKDLEKSKCYSNAPYTRLLFEMFVLALHRQAVPYSYNLDIVRRTVNQGYILGNNVKDPVDPECSKVTTETQITNLITAPGNGTNNLPIARQGTYMVFANLQLKNLQRCPANPNSIHVRSSENIVIKDTINPKQGLLVAQSQTYLAFVKLKTGDNLRFRTSDTSTMESDWKMNTFGALLIS